DAKAAEAALSLSPSLSLCVSLSLPLCVFLSVSLSLSLCLFLSLSVSLSLSPSLSRSPSLSLSLSTDCLSVPPQPPYHFCQGAHVYMCFFHQDVLACAYRACPHIPGGLGVLFYTLQT